MAPGVSGWLKAGARVEVTSDEEGFVGSWYAATVLCHRKRHFAIQYESLVTDSGEALVEQALMRHLRPLPPALEGTRQWAVGDQVEAYDNDGWWVGVVCQCLPSKDSFVVYFECTSEKKVFSASQIRPRQDWLHGKWVIMTQGFKHNVQEVSAFISKDQVAGESLYCGKTIDDEQPQGDQSKQMALQKFTNSPQICCGNEPESVNIRTRKQPFEDGSILIPESTKHLSQTGREQPSTLTRSPCGTDSNGSNRDSQDLQERKKSKIKFSSVKEQGVMVPVCEAEIVSTCPRMCLDGDKRLSFLESQSERLSKGTQSSPLEQIDGISADRTQNVSCSAARGRSEPVQKVEDKHYENRARLAIAKNGGTARKVHPCHLCCNCAVANFPELESPSGNCGGNGECASTLGSQNLDTNAYAAVLRAFYSKGPITWQQELLITDLRKHLNISSEEHLLQLLRIMSHN